MYHPFVFDRLRVNSDNEKSKPVIRIIYIDKTYDLYDKLTEKFMHTKVLPCYVCLMNPEQILYEKVTDLDCIRIAGVVSSGTEHNSTFFYTEEGSYKGDPSFKTPQVHHQLYLHQSPQCKDHQGH